MVEYTLSLDNIFGCLADPTRRDILQRLTKQQFSVSQLAQHYDLTFAAVSKHIKVLEKARLVMKHRKGKQQFVQLAPQALAPAADYLESYRQMWEERFEALDKLLKEDL